MKKLLEGLKFAVVYILWNAALILIERGIAAIYCRTLSPWWFLAYVNFHGLYLYLHLTNWFILLWILFPDKEERKKPDWRREWKARWRKLLRIGGVVTVFFLVVVNFFPVSMRLGIVRLNDKKPTLLTYNAAILKDAFLGETRLVRQSHEAVKVSGGSYSYPAGRGAGRGVNHGRKTASTYYLAFQDGETSFQSFLADRTLMNYYQQVEEVLQKSLE